MNLTTQATLQIVTNITNIYTNKTANQRIYQSLDGIQKLLVTPLSINNPMN